MPYFTYDTSVFISRRLTDFHEMPQSFLLSSVVLMEIAASAYDESRRKFYERIFQQYKKDDRLIVPKDDDWLLTSKILYLLTHMRRRAHQGRLRRMPAGASQRLALDVLIAVSARRWKAQVVTDNWTDFKAIQRYCNTKVIKAANFFRR